jgi:hypothetical protein
MHLNATPFDGRADAPAQYRVHLLMEGVQGFTRSHWAPPSGKYSRRIAPADNGVTCRIKKDKKLPYLSAVLLALAVRRYDIKHISQRRGSRATTEATGRCHRGIIWAWISSSDIPMLHFWVFFEVWEGRCVHAKWTRLKAA